MAVTFTAAASIFGAALISCGVYCWRFVPEKPDLWKTLPRERHFGFFIGLACLIWSANLAIPMLEGGLAGLRRILFPAVIVMAVLSSFLLDYLFTRAVGGLLLLTANHLLHMAFAEHAAMRPLFSLVCYAIGITGGIMIATPYRFRNVLQKLHDDSSWRLWVTASLIGSGVLSVAVALL
jgi:hypothetical protein